MSGTADNMDDTIVYRPDPIYRPTFRKREQIRQVQLERLNLVLTCEKERGGFYSGLPDHLDSLAELEKLPFTTESDLLQYGDSMVLTSLRSVQKIITGSTSGTSGRVKRLFYTSGDMENTISLFMDGISEMLQPARGFETAGGFEPADDFWTMDSSTAMEGFLAADNSSATDNSPNVLIGFPDTGSCSLGNLIATAVTRLHAVPVIQSTAVSCREIRETIDRTHPQYYIGLPQPLLALLRIYGCMSFRRALVSGDECVPSVMEGIERILDPSNQEPGQVQYALFPHYGSREMGLAGAVTCSSHSGMHLREDCVIAEIVDEEGKRVPDGTFGELVITTAGLEAQPLIRYRTGDRTRILPGVCSCGRETIRLDTVTRVGNVMAQVDNRMFHDPELVDCRAILTKNEELQVETLHLKDITGSSRPFYVSKRYLITV